ncbi:unnamed protein product [marine sediment metagenome]|uniref:Uncharacterized protein n=1 Tax=marine sediment metagenome TaxID=412755 RepID=X1SCW2_9ZZZZ
MEAITRVTFNKWAQKNNWMQVNEAASSTGRNYTFITPSGSLIIVMLDLKGNLISLGQPVPVPQSPLGIPKTR